MNILQDTDRYPALDLFHVDVFFNPSLPRSTCVICVCLHIVVSNTYFVVFLFCLYSSYVPYVASFFGLSILTMGR